MIKLIALVCGIGLSGYILLSMAKMGVHCWQIVPALCALWCFYGAIKEKK